CTYGKRQLDLDYW
nr:immunoglobulin heavy chain junction region [Macaca mulatta]MOW77439.1 immunoglobulin heavy chain junction region [Macaca mulatta]MOW81409.1 immunoglobulin heavy chain junction region [Macaca mulatta]MOW82491.1 immunoglobulin heavy chain junction region [Macaca mulatta]MOW83946.1 immunoglobulin heavy chain junction region [Macaca mulatta]